MARASPDRLAPSRVAPGARRGRGAHRGPARRTNEERAARAARRADRDRAGPRRRGVPSGGAASELPLRTRSDAPARRHRRRARDRGRSAVGLPRGDADVTDRRAAGPRGRSTWAPRLAVLSTILLV